MLRDADKLLAPAVERTLGELELGTADDAVATLAQRYAATIDAAEDQAEALTDLGPKLLATLAQLQATPAARSKVRGVGGAGAGPNRLKALRDARRA